MGINVLKYRVISLLSHINKIFTRNISEWLLIKLDQYQTENKQDLDLDLVQMILNTLVVKSTDEKYVEYKKLTILSFVRVKKAFGSVI